MADDITKDDLTEEPEVVDASGGFLSSINDVEGPAVDELEDEEEEDVDLLNQGQYLDDASDDSVRLYLREIGKIPLLNGEEEFELAQKVVANRDALTEVQEQLAELEEQAADGRDSKKYETFDSVEKEK